MSRIKVDMPDVFLFSTTIHVRATDLNYGGHVGNDQVLRYFQEARVQFYQHLGFKDEVNIDGDIGQIIADAAVSYKAESFLGDVLDVEVGVLDINKYGFDLCYRMTKVGSGKEVAIGKTGIVFFDYNIKKVTPIPNIFKEKLGI